VTTLLAFAALGVLVYAVMTPEMRARVVPFTVDAGHRLIAYAGEPPDTFRAALRQRTPRPLATLTIAAVHVLVFAAMLVGKGALGDPATLLAWGANAGPRTTNGEWWRFVTAPFVHPGLASMLIETAALVQIGWTVERLVGPFAFAAAYAIAAIAAGMAAVAIVPLGVTYGSAAAIAGLYAILLMMAVRSSRQQTGLVIPPAALTRFAPLGALFLFYVLGSAAPVFRAALTAAAAAVLFALAFVGNVGDALPQPRRVAYGLGVAVAVSAALAFTMRGIADVRPELQKLVGIEHQTAAAYDTALDRFRKGTISAAGLTKTIDEVIVPALRASDERIRRISGVPREDRQLIDDAREYIRVRIDSWHLRAQGLYESSQSAFADARDAASYRDRVSARHRTASLTLGRAESAQRAALEILTQLTAKALRDSTL